MEKHFSEICNDLTSQKAKKNESFLKKGAKHKRTRKLYRRSNTKKDPDNVLTDNDTVDVSFRTNPMPTDIKPPTQPMSNEQIEKLRNELTYSIMLIDRVEINGLDKAIEFSSQKDQFFLCRFKDTERHALEEKLNEERENLIKQLLTLKAS